MQHLLRFLTLFVLAAPSFSQVASGARTDLNEKANTSIVGTVFGPTGKPVNMKMTLRLSSMLSGEIMGNTDEYGRFIFSKVGADNYTLIIDGENDYEPASQQITINGSSGTLPETYTVSIRLVEKAKAATAKPAVVDQGNLNVSHRASDYYKKAGELSKAGDNKGAAEQLELAVSEYPNFFDGYNELGAQYMKLNQLEKADEALKAAAKLKPDNYEPQINRGITLFRLKRYVDAEPLLSNAISLKKDSAVAHYYLGRTLMASEKWDAAETELNQAVILGGDSMKEAHRMLANLFIQKGEDQKAVNELEIYLKLAPDAPDADNLRKVMGQLRAPGPPQKPQ